MGRTVLIIDDDADIRDAIVEVIATEGFSAVTAGDGAFALRQLEDGLRPCAILLDLMMPVMSGRDLYERLRPELRSKVIVMTAGRPALFGPPVIRKPFDIAVLIAQLNRVCHVG